MTTRASLRSPRLLGALAALAAGSLLMGCSAHAPVASLSAGSVATGAPVRAGVPTERGALSARHEAGGGDARQAEAVLQRAETAFAVGQAALLTGDEEKAYDAFDEAVGAVLSSGLDLDIHPDLRDRAEALVASIHALAVAEAAEPEVAGEEAPEVPVLGEDADGAEAISSCCQNLQVPMVSHPAVDAMVRFYTGRAKERFELGLARYGKYAPTVSRILKEEGVPPEIAWLALVESNYNPQAYSRARARGLWQFISATGRRYGLKQDFWVDERADFEKATRSAARYLKDLHAMFGDWHLALASYNAGEGRIARAVRSTGTRDFWRIRESRYIRRETKDYVPAFLAVVKVIQDPSAYGIDMKPMSSLDWELAPVRSCTDLGVIAQCAGTTVETMVDLNPELRRGTTPGGDDPYMLRIPSGTRAQFEEKYSSLPPEQLLTWHRHVVRRGDTVARIASTYATSAGAVMAANRLTSASRLAPGQALLIPAGPSIDAVPDSYLASRAPRQPDIDDGAAPTGSRRITYRVRPGDTLGKIAARHGTSIARLADWNGLRNTNRIHVGQRLTIHARGTATARSGGSSASSRTAWHVVRAGDTLTSIARKHGVSVALLRRLNGLGGSSMIRPGQRLKVSSSGRTAGLDASATDQVAALAPRGGPQVAD